MPVLGGKEGRTLEKRGGRTVRGNVSDRALEAILQLLVEHEYRPGERLFETILAERLNISRTPVRTALTRLVTCGFLERCPRKRGYLIPLLDPEDMRLVFETRALLEGALAAQAARNRYDEDIAELREICEEERAAFEAMDKKTYAECNVNFHLSIASFARNPYLEPCLNQVFWRSRLYDFFLSGFYNRPLTKEQRQKRRSCTEHAAILEAIAARDTEKARELMQQHLAHTYEHIDDTR